MISRFCSWASRELIGGTSGTFCFLISSGKEEEILVVLKSHSRIRSCKNINILAFPLTWVFSKTITLMNVAWMQCKYLLCETLVLHSREGYKENAKPLVFQNGKRKPWALAALEGEEQRVQLCGL